jgi:o-succinylbenzoate---CoA ligase
MSGALSALERWPDDAPALAWPGGGMRYAELRARIAALARRMGPLGAPGSPIAIISASRLSTTLGVLAALRAGRPVLPLDPGRPDRAACLERCAIGAALADASVELPHALPRGDLAPGAGRPAGGEPARAPVPPARGATLLVPTSGTGGPARVAMLSPGALAAQSAASAAVLPSLGPGDRWLSCLPMGSIGSLAALWRALSAGACLAFLEGFDPAEARRLMAEGASHVSVVPAMLAPLADARAPAPRGLRCLLSGGGPLSAKAADRARAAGWPLWNCWGMTETASHAAAGQVDAGWREGVVGRPLPGISIEVAAGGHLSVAGATLMSGYARPGLAPGDGLAPDGRLPTNDLGEWLEDGRLRILGRADHVIVTGGVNVHPEGVEAALDACPGIGEVAVTGRPDARWGEVIVAIYTGNVPPEAVEAWSREHLSSASRPREFRHVARLPRNAMGKLLRAALPALLGSP